MRKVKRSANKRLGLAFFWLTTAVAAIVALVGNPEVPQWSIVVLLVLAGASASACAYYFDLYRAPIPIGTVPRALIILTFIWICIYWFYQKLGPRPRVVYLETYVYLEKPTFPVFANITFQNVGGKGKMTTYGLGAVTMATANPSEVRQQLQQAVTRLIRQGGGLSYSIGPQEKKWFTIMGPTLTLSQADQMKNSQLAFYFYSTFVADPGGEYFDYCGYVVGGHADTVLDCPE